MAPAIRARDPSVLVRITLCLGVITAPAAAQTPLDATTIPQFVEALPHFAGARVDGTQPLTITMSEFQQLVLPESMYSGLPAPFAAGTWVWGYGIRSFDGSSELAPPLYPGFTVEARRGVPTTVRFVNSLVNPVLQSYLRVDQTLHWANPLGAPVGDPLTTPYSGPVPAAPHLHGGQTPSAFDGGPDQWFTASGLRGPGYRSLPGAGPNEAIYRYANDQEAATLWFHDHALGSTRLNVYAGLAAFWLLRDDFDAGELTPPGMPQRANQLPYGPYEIEVAIQDRMFDTNGQWYYPSVGDNPEHPFWIPEFLGDVMVVNGKTWPYLDVEPRRYRFRLLNGSNARFYSMWLEDTGNGRPGPSFWQIGTDGGLLDRAAEVAPADPADPRKLVLAPGERADVIIDFARFDGRTLRLYNDAASPYPFGDPVEPGLTDRILEFRVNQPLQGRDRSFDPSRGGMRLRTHRMTDLARAARLRVDERRLLTLNEVMGDFGPLEALLNNTKWSGREADSGDPVPGSFPDAAGNFVTEGPRVGATELWQIVNLTGDAHPIHLHLVQFQLLSRQAYDPGYEAAYEDAFPTDRFEPAMGPPLDYMAGNPLARGGNPEVLPYLVDQPRPAAANERGWKDTVIALPGEVTTLVVRYAPQSVPEGQSRAGRNQYAFDPTEGPGYVWHCHILDHEDNEMMRPFAVRR